MDLAPGPFLQGLQSDVTIAPGVYDFTDDALTLSSELLAIYHDWDAFMEDLPLLAVGPVDPTFGIDDDALAAELANEISLATFPDLDTVATEMGIAGDLLNLAIVFAPPAAWSTPTLPFVPPDPTATIVSPTVPVGDFTPDVTGLVGTPSSTTLPTVTLANTTRVGTTNFTVGDKFLVTITGPPNTPVTVDAIFNGVDLGTTTMGSTDANGNWSLSGTEGPDQVGLWLETWKVGDLFAATYQFMVSPSS